MAGYQPKMTSEPVPMPPLVNAAPTSGPPEQREYVVCCACGVTGTRDKMRTRSKGGFRWMVCEDAAACGDRAGSGLFGVSADPGPRPAVVDDQARADRRAHALHAAVAFLAPWSSTTFDQVIELADEFDRWLAGGEG